jgi:hypothetical protein
VPQTEFTLGRSESRHISSLTINAVTRLAIGLLIAALIVIALTNPSGAQMNKGVRLPSPPSNRTITPHFLSDACRTGPRTSHDQKGMVRRASVCWVAQIARIGVD